MEGDWAEKSKVWMAKVPREYQAGWKRRRDGNITGFRLSGNCAISSVDNNSSIFTVIGGVMMC